MFLLTAASVGTPAGIFVKPEYDERMKDAWRENAHMYPF